jgi:transketolase
MRDVVVQHLYIAAKKDKNIVLLTGDLGFGVLDDFARDLPDQFINVGVAEQNMAMVAAGLALSGKKVFTYSIANFNTLRCLEQLRNDVCYHGLDVTTISVGAGFSYGQLGASHFATEDIAVMRAMPNMRVVAPSSKADAGLLIDQIIEHGGPCYLRIDKSAVSAPDSRQLCRLGEVSTLSHAPDTLSDLTFFGYGGILQQAVDARLALVARGLKVNIIDVHTIKPLDEDAIVEIIEKTKVVVTIEEHNKSGGINELIAQVCCARGCVPSAYVSFCLPDVFPKVVGEQTYLLKHFGLDAVSIVNSLTGKGLV